ncbi:MAG TPA: GSCFA domain-containing protein [Flavobacterium sp.]|jgi:lysophospholipase L1-like esterase
MEFRTQVPIKFNDHPIDYDSQIVSLGSCFAVNIAEKFGYYKFRNTVNPFGILFHPLALQKVIEFATTTKVFTEKDIFFHNGRWHCFDAHSDLSDPDKTSALEKLNSARATTKAGITRASHIIITLGTAWAYRRPLTGEVVANCHKVPQKQFMKELLPVDLIIDSLNNIMSFLQRQNPDVQIVFTVSPVRHIKDGFAENQRSKAHLIAAVHDVVARFSNACYFPSYEIMIDELRDYRFYGTDMLHPNQIAVDYIWERFSEHFVSPEACSVMKEVEAIQKALSHRPFNESSAEHQQFAAKTATRISSLQKQHPHLSF